jgi:hypothetical protein
VDQDSGAARLHLQVIEADEEVGYAWMRLEKAESVQLIKSLVSLHNLTEGDLNGN